MKQRSIVALLIVALSSVLLASGSAAAKDENGDARSGFVTSWDEAKIHYIEAGTSRLASRTEASTPSTSRGTAKGNVSAFDPQRSPSVLFVPGFMMPAWIWEKQIAHFSGAYHVVAMDLRSQGESSKTSDGDYPAAHARDINAVIERLQLAPVVIVGWSMGVTLIASYIEQFGTSSLAGIVFVDGLAGFDLTPEYYESRIGFLKGLQVNRSQRTADFVRSMYRKQQSEEYLQKVAKAALATPTDSAVAMGLAAFTTDNRPLMAKIDKPTLIAAATKSLLSQFQDTQKSISGAKLEFFDDAGHALFVDDPDKFNRVLQEFLSGLR